MADVNIGGGVSSTSVYNTENLNNGGNSDEKKYQTSVIDILSSINSTTSRSESNETIQNGLLTSIYDSLQTKATVQPKENVTTNVNIKFSDKSKVPDLLNMAFSTDMNSVSTKVDTFATSVVNALEKIEKVLPIAEKVGTVFNAVAMSIKTISEAGISTFAKLGMGIALLGLSIYGFSLVPLEAIAKFGITFWAISKLMATPQVMSASNTFIKIGFGIAAMGLSIYGFNELVGLTGALEFSVGFGAILGVLYTFNKFVKKPKELGMNLGIIGASLGVIGVSMLIYSQVGYESMGKAALALGGVVGALALLQKIKVNPLGLIGIGAISVTLIPLAYGISMFNDVEYDSLAKAALAVGGLTGALALAGKLGANVLIGATSLAIGALSIIGLAYAFSLVSETEINEENATKFGLGVVAIIGVFGVAGLAGGVITAGALALGAVSGAIVALVYAIEQVNTIQFDPSKPQIIREATLSIMDALTFLANPLYAPLLVIATANSVLIAATTLAMAGAVSLVALAKVPDEKQTTGFATTVTKLGEMYDNLGWSAISIGIGTAAGLAMSVSTVAIAGAIFAFSKLSIDNKTVTSATKSMDIFITEMSKTFEKNKANFDAVEDGIDAFTGISSLLSGVATGVSDIGNMKFTESEVVNGKLVIKSVRSFTEDDFKKVGSSVASIMGALTEPLSAIGSMKDSVEVFGMKITNPFSNSVENGITAMKDIGMVFDPLTNIVNTMSTISDVSKVTENTKALFTGVFGVIGSSIVSYNDTTKDIDAEKVGNGLHSMTKFIDNISGENGTKATANMATLNVEMTKFKDIMNSLDADKLVKFNDITMNIKGFDKDAIQELSNAMNELSKLLYGSEMGSNTSTSTTNNSKNVVVNKQQEKENAKIQQQEQLNDMISVVKDSNTALIGSFNQLLEAIRDGSMRGTVKLANANGRFS